MTTTPPTPLPATPVRDYGALAARIRAAARPPVTLRRIGQQAGPSGPPSGSSDGWPGYDLFLLRIPASQAGRGGAPWRVYLNGGTHGDEPAGAEAVTRFLEAGHYRDWPEVAFTVTPCLNPWGYAHDRREGPGGRDLNRAFRRAGPATREVSLIKRALRGQVFDLFLDCHEDVDAPGLYVFAPGALGRAIVARTRALGPVHPGPAVDGEIPLKESVVVLDDAGDRFRERRRVFTTWPLPLYVARYHHHAPLPVPPAPATGPAGAPADQTEPPDFSSMATATIETPTTLPGEQRVAMHLVAIDAALHWLTGRPGPLAAPAAGPATGAPPPAA